MSDVRLQAVTACVDICGRYAWALDSRDADAFARCFAADGVFEVTFPDGRTTRRAGCDELRAFVVELGPARPRTHVTYAPAVEAATADEIRATTVWSTLGPSEAGALESYGRYADHLVRGADGDWRLKLRSASVSWTSPDFHTPAQ